MSKSTDTLKEGKDPNQTSALPFKRRVRIQFDLEYNGDSGKIMSSEQKTVPDFNLTVRQLIENHTRGHNDETIVKQPLYFETEIPQMHDMTDVTAFKEHLMDRLTEIDNFIIQEQKDAKIANAKSTVANPTEDTKKQTPDPQPSDTSTKRDKDPSAQP